jgi:carbamate kinase
VLTHGNGPQVGNLLVKNELAAHVVPPVPLDWCVAQTQATIAFTLADELDAALAARGLPQRTAGLVTRTLIDVDDPGFREPSKPVGRFLPREEANGSSPSVRGGRTAGSVAGGGWSPLPNPGPSSTPPRSTHWPRPVSSSSAPGAVASRWPTTATQA